MTEWGKMGKERLREFREYVERVGYFLGVWKDDDKNDHLVVTKNNPTGEKQYCFFVFGWVNTDTKKVFVSPKEVVEYKVFPLGEIHSLNISPEEAMPRFENARKKLEEYAEYRKKYNF